MTQANRFRTACLASVIWAVIAVMTATAAPITVTGGFFTFHGPVAYPPGSPEHTGLGPSFLNGTQVAPDTPSSRPGVGLTTFDLAGASSIDFFNEGERHNLLQFTPAPEQDVVFGQEFRIGTFTVQNGDWFGGLGEGDSLFSFFLTTSSSDLLYDGHVFTDTIIYRTTQFAPGNTPEQNADTFSFLGRSDLGLMSVYELSDSPTGTNIGTVDLYGRIGSLIPTRLANAQGGAFIVVNAVPEPGIYALFLGGLALARALSSRRKR